jgi:DNA-binding transcriptional ArsR family regulator
MGSHTVELTDDVIDLVAQRFRLLGEPMRLRLLRGLEAGERTVNELTDALGGNQANVSRHLTAMFEAGLLNRRREGSNVRYSIADPVVFKLCELVCNSAREQLRIRLGAFGAPAARRFN